MRRFTAEYLSQSRTGLWADREALAALDLESREAILDVGCGTGELTGVLQEESPADVVGLDADRSLLEVAPADERVLGDAMGLPFADDAVDLVVCQALLVNLPDPEAAIRELARVASETVAAIEPDNAAVTVESTVEVEADLARRAREAYIEGIDTDATLGDLTETFERVGLSNVTSTLHRHEKRIEPPYSERAVESAARKASGARLTEKRATLLAGDLDVESYDAFLADWVAMGRDVVDAMQAGTYERTETVPFYVTVGDVPEVESDEDTTR